MFSRDELKQFEMQQKLSSPKLRFFIGDVRDRTADVARGGDGNDSVVADTPNLDVLDGFEHVDRSEAGAPRPAVTPGRGAGKRLQSTIAH